MERPEGRMRMDAGALEAGNFFSPTLDEPVRETIMRDARSIGYKLLYVLKPQRLYSSPRPEAAGLRQWDLWGPLLLCVLLSIVLYIQASFSVSAVDGSAIGGGDARESAAIAAAERAERRDRQRVAFSLVYVLVSLGASVVTINAKLLGSTNISFFQSVCVLGYCLFPLNIAAFVNLFIGKTFMLVKLLLVFLALRWSGGASVAFLSDMVPDEKRALAVYPAWLFYTAMAWIICSA